jgi:hypothetical protein
MGWQTTGGAKRKSGTGRIWAGLALWNGTTCIVWVLVAAWRAHQYGIANFAVLLCTGLFAGALTVMALASKRNHARVRRAVAE